VRQTQSLGAADAVARCGRRSRSVRQTQSLGAVEPLRAVEPLPGHRH
jgi:hypothetical protein